MCPVELALLDNLLSGILAWILDCFGVLTHIFINVIPNSASLSHMVLFIFWEEVEIEVADWPISCQSTCQSNSGQSSHLGN